MLRQWKIANNYVLRSTREQSYQGFVFAIDINILTTHKWYAKAIRQQYYYYVDHEMNFVVVVVVVGGVFIVNIFGTRSLIFHVNLCANTIFVLFGSTKCIDFI